MNLSPGALAAFANQSVLDLCPGELSVCTRASAPHADPQVDAIYFEKAARGLGVTNYASMKLDSVMMHQVVRAANGESGFDTVLTDVPVELSAGDLNYLVGRFVTSLANRALPIVQRDANPHPARDALLDLWAGKMQVTQMSRELAASLATTQPGTAAEGLLVVAIGKLGSEDAVVIAKVEHQEAMRLEPTVTEDGNNVFTVELLRDLVFGDKTRVFKVAVFVKSWSSTGFAAGEAIDEQSDHSIAQYFLGKFLGMKLREDPSVLTESMMNGLTKAINDSTMSGDQKLDAQSALLAEFRSNEKQLDPQAFIRKHVPDGHAKEVGRLAQAASSPMVVFTKDTSRIAGRMKRVRIDMDRDITLVAPPEEIGQDGAIQVVDDERGTSVVIRDVHVESVRPGAR